MAADVSEIRRAIAGLISAAERSEAELKALAHRRARAVHAGVYNRLPSATGKTRAALHIVDDSSKKQFRVEVADIPGRDPMVVVYLEFGTVGMAARPSFRPAIDENRDEYTREAEQLITDLTEKALS